MIPKELLNAKPMTGKERLGANRDSEYLGAEDIEPGTEPVLTIKALYNAKITLARGKEQHDVIVFAEERVPSSINTVRPLVVNATNRKTLRKIYKAVDAESLVGKRIQLYIEHDVRDPSTGDKVDGIRIRNKIPAAATQKTEPIICEDCGNRIEAFGKYSAEDMAKIAFNRFGKKLCVACGKKISDAKEAEQKQTQQTEQNTTEQTETAPVDNTDNVTEETENA